MKKLLSFALCLILLLTSALPAFAVDDAGQAVIIVPGVVESMLLFDEEPNYSRKFFAPAGDWLRADGTIKDLVFAALKALFLFNYKDLDQMMIRLNDATFGALSMAPDGTPKHRMRTVIEDAEGSSLTAIRSIDRWDDVDYGAMPALELEKHVGADNVFVFCYDWRLDSTQHARRLNDFIADVKALTGVDKVSLYGNSYGCQVVAKYLYDYENGENVDNVVFNAPAWRGTRIFKGLMAQSPETLDFDIRTGARVLLRFFGMEYYIEPLLRLIPDRIVKRIAYTMIEHTMDAHLLYAPGLWCCCATDDYEEMKAQLLDPVRDAGFIAKIDEVQYGIMRHIPEMLAQAQADGISVAITMNDGTPLFAGDRINGDGVVDVVSATGGESVPFGSTFTDGRTGDHVSPTNAFDLTDSMLPERTWVTTGQVHGQTYWDDTTRTLLPKLLLTDEIATVDSDPAFPQFMDTHCPADGVSVRMTGGAAKTLDPAKGKVVVEIRNDSEKNNVFITGVTVCGLKYIASPAVGKLAPGQSRIVTLTPTTDDAAPRYGEVRVTFVGSGILPLPRCRTQAFKVG